ncbi:hypothetical protein [Rhizobium sp. BK176]|uniref:hypothetical protein n=1 Tax=Rhizobium sp. BK176 TaxID=2587071 RepID=UPI002168A3E1|nr:hypothetical protein [Rhizobium sp. BK176]MCS4089265.1 hypothetical protein [Rhizobium sp. BK176]
MFGLFRKRAQNEVAADFLQELAIRVSGGYRAFGQSMARTLVSRGVPRKPLEALASSPNSAYYFCIGVACEQMQVSLELLGPDGAKINAAITEQMIRSGMPFGGYETGRAITEIREEIISSPTNSRVFVTRALFSRQGFMTREVLHALRDPATQALINATTVVDGVSGSMKAILARRGLVAADK